MELQSTNYARLIAWLAYKRHNVILGKTQLQKLLFISYGCTLARRGQKLFTDDTPKVWPFGPVFPRTYKRYQPEYIELSDEEKIAFVKDIDTLKMVVDITDSYYDRSAVHLTAWSHKDGSPWRKAFIDNGKRWNGKIKDEDIEAFFSSDSWKEGL